jgi:hypothetical protein
MPYQVDDALLHAMPGTELSRVRTELRLLPPEPNNQRLLASRGADIVMQSSGLDVRSSGTSYREWLESQPPRGDIKAKAPIFNRLAAIFSPSKGTLIYERQPPFRMETARHDSRKPNVSNSSKTNDFRRDS